MSYVLDRIPVKRSLQQNLPLLFSGQCPQPEYADDIGDGSFDCVLVSRLSDDTGIKRYDFLQDGHALLYMPELVPCIMLVHCHWYILCSVTAYPVRVISYC